MSAQVIGGVSVSRKRVAQSRKGCVVNVQTTKGINNGTPPPLPPRTHHHPGGDNFQAIVRTLMSMKTILKKDDITLFSRHVWPRSSSGHVLPQLCNPVSMTKRIAFTH